MIGKIISFTLVIALVSYFLRLLLKYNEKANSYFEKIIIKKRKGLRESPLPQMSYNLTVEELGTLYSVHPTKEDAEKVLEKLPFLTIRSFGVYAEEIDPKTNNIQKWKIKDGFSLWIKQDFKQDNP